LLAVKVITEGSSSVGPAAAAKEVDVQLSTDTSTSAAAITAASGV